jgi:hypothetical protein
MSEFLLGVAVAFFMAAIVNHKYNSIKWIKTRYIVWLGVVAFILSVIFGWSDVKAGFMEGFMDASATALYIETSEGTSRMTDCQSGLPS